MRIMLLFDTFSAVVVSLHTSKTQHKIAHVNVALPDRIAVGGAKKSISQTSMYNLGSS